MEKVGLIEGVSDAKINERCVVEFVRSLFRRSIIVPSSAAGTPCPATVDCHTAGPPSHAVIHSAPHDSPRMAAANDGMDAVPTSVASHPNTRDQNAKRREARPILRPNDTATPRTAPRPTPPHPTPPHSLTAPTSSM